MKIGMIGCVAVMGMGLMLGCDDRGTEKTTTTETKTTTSANGPSDTQKMSDSVQNGLDKAADATKRGVDKTADALSNAAEKTKDALTPAPTDEHKVEIKTETTTTTEPSSTR